MKTLHLTHCDLDGVVSEILIKHVFKEIDTKICGYNKLTNILEEKKYTPYHSLIITDLSVDEQYYKKLFQYFGKYFLYIDHHKTSEGCKKYKGTYKHDIKYSASTLTYIFFRNKFKYKKGIFELVKYTDAYDMWRTDLPEFKTGKHLNILYWHFGHYDFYYRFMDGFDGFHKKEKEIIDLSEKETIYNIEQTEKIELDNGVCVFVGADSKYVNEYILYYNKCKLVFIIYVGQSGSLHCSIRSTMKYINVGKILKGIKDKNVFPFIISAGGHKEAAGINFSKETTLDDIFNVIEFIYKVVLKFKG